MRTVRRHFPHLVDFTILVGLLGCIVPEQAHAQLKDASVRDYNQWKLALGGSGVASPVSISARPGFQVEIVRTAAAGEGSWISLTFDPQGRLVVGREDKGLLRMTLDANGTGIRAVESIEETLLEPRGLLFAHGALYVHANNSKALYRLRDTDSDGVYDERTLLRRTEGGVGHGRNGLALGPDGKIYLAIGNNVELPSDVASGSPYRNFGHDRLLPCAWNEFLFDAGVKPPAGHIVRTDAEGKSWELVAGGFRNPYDLAFNRDGELFTYDADMEWDVGAPWYRSTCVMHVVPGGEYGWRQGTSVWPDGFPDALPRVADIGLGSPTGVVFGEGAKFPEPYQSALYVLDWAYGRIIAVHLTPDGASYRGKAETFLKGKPLNVTDAVIGPDGAMYFTVGGRRTQSALYRVRWTGEAAPKATSKTPAAGMDEPAETARALRRTLVELAPATTEESLNRLWKGLGDQDPWIQHAARISLENSEFQGWRDRMLRETDPRTAAMAALAAARVAPNEFRPELLKRLQSVKAATTSEEQRRIVWRTAQLLMLRMGPLSDAETASLRSWLESAPPAATFAEQQLLCELLVAVQSPRAIQHALRFHAASTRQEEQLFALFVLRNHRAGWTTENRRVYFEALKAAEQFRGAQAMSRSVTFIRTDALATLSDSERNELQPVLSHLGKPNMAAASGPARPFVKAWTLDELAGLLDPIPGKVDRERGQALFAAARCRDCHRFDGAGTPFGPDLEGATARFSRRDLLETIVHPSKVVDEKYRNLILETEEGEVIAGSLAGGDVQSLAIAVDPLEPTRIRRVARSSIVTRKTSPLSPMPEGLLNTLTLNEIRELIGYLDSVSEP